LIAEVIKMDAAIQKAQERLAFVAGDKEALREYHLREMALSDWTSGVNHARREGRKEGAKELLDLLAQGKTLEEAGKILNLE
jgi:hypothetical protein